MRVLQQRVAFVERVAIAVVVERHDLGAVVLAHRASADPAFIDVVAQVHHQVQVLFGHMLVGGVEAGFVVLAGGESETQSVHHGRGRRTRARHRSLETAGTELIEIPARRAQAVDFHMHRMAEVRRGHGLAFSYAFAESLVLGENPFDIHGLVRHATASQRIKGEAGP